MDTEHKKLLIGQLDSKIEKIKSFKKIEIAGNGWINSIRTSLGMSLSQLAKKMKISAVSVREMELREKEDRISLKKLREAAEALDCDLVYGFIPKQGSIVQSESRKPLISAHKKSLTKCRNIYGIRPRVQ